MKKQMFAQIRQGRAVLLGLAIVIAALATMAASQDTKPDDPPVPIVDPGPIGGPPSDAIVLFGGKDISAWKGKGDKEARWDVADGALITNRTGNIFTKQEFGDVQLHVEWASPTEIKGKGQGRGNSGIYLQGRYEIQVLDSYKKTNLTYTNGQAGALYGKFPPLVNPCKKAGEWQIYDIIFDAPKPAPDGKEVIPGSITVLYNGVLVQHHVPVKGSTTAAAFKGVAAKGPLMLQDHGNPVRYRNIWIRPLN
jgi:hypothetical protein